MIEEFSDGYYRARMDVQPYEDGPVIERSVYSFIEDELLDGNPDTVAMRVGLDASPVFAVDAEAAVPKEVLALPPHLVDDTGRHNVFVCKEPIVHG